MKVNELLENINKLAPDEKISELEKLADEIKSKLKEKSEKPEFNEDDLNEVLQIMEETKDEIAVLDTMLSEKRKTEDKNLEDITAQEAVVNQKKKEEDAIAELKRDENFYGKPKYQGDSENKDKLEFEAGKKHFYEKTAAEELIEEHKQKDKYAGKSLDYKS